MCSNVFGMCLNVVECLFELFVALIVECGECFEWFWMFECCVVFVACFCCYVFAVLDV